MTRQTYRNSRQVVDVTDFGAIDFDEEIEVRVPKFAWVVARSYLSLQAQKLSSYAVEYFTNGYDTPSPSQMDEIRANLAEFIAEEAPMPGFLVGQIVTYAGSFLPDNFLWCNGVTFDALVYTELFSVIGYTYGVDGGDPKTPNLQERVPYGSSISHPRGEEGGEATHTLTVSEMPAHAHMAHWFAGGSGWRNGGDRAGYTHLSATSSVGGGAAHQNMPPYLALPFIIYAGQ